MWARFAIAGVLIVLLSGGATATIALTKLNHIAKEVFPKGSQLHVAKGVVETAYSGEPQTFMIIGSDRRAGSKDAYDRNNPPHSDTLLLVHLDPNYGQISVLVGATRPARDDHDQKRADLLPEQDQRRLHDRQPEGRQQTAAWNSRPKRSSTCCTSSSTA